MLHVENLSAGYGDVAVLHQVGLDVGANEVVGVLGCNGAGKTTLVKAIMGLLPRVTGDVRFQGQSINGLRTHAIARRGAVSAPSVYPTFMSRFRSISKCLKKPPIAPDSWNGKGQYQSWRRGVVSTIVRLVI